MSDGANLLQPRSTFDRLLNRNGGGGGRGGGGYEQPAGDVFDGPEVHGEQDNADLIWPQMFQ